MIASFVTLAQRPDLVEQMWSMPRSWPTFMLQDPVGNAFYPQLPDVFPEYQLLALDDRERILGKVHGVPFAWSGDEADLPARGWDRILERAFAERERGEQPTAVSLIEAHVVADHRGEGLSRELLTAARRNTQLHGFDALFGPVRPTGKSKEPRTPMSDYAARRRSDGLPADSWLRVHVRLGARIVKVCPLSMTIPGTLAEWREWTGLAFDQSGPLELPEALVPMHVSIEHDHAVYVEPNVWVYHRLSNPPTLDS